MSGDVVLTAALRNNLLSLQGTQRSIDQTQLRLATGLKVNSALDNPLNFFTAQSLNNRASDLEALLDGIGQSVRVIEEANIGVESINDLIQQAQSVAVSAQDQLAAAEDTTVIETSSSVDLANIDNFGDLANSTFTLTITVGATTGTNTNNTVMITSAESIGSLVADLDAIDDIEASLTADGQLRISSTGGESIRIQANGSTSVFTDPLSLGLATSAIGTDDLSFAPANQLTSDLVVAGAVANRTQNFTALDGFTGATGAFTITVTTVGGATATATGAANMSISDFVDSINTNLGSAANPFGISASYDDASGEFEIQFDNQVARNVAVTGFGTNSDFNFGNEIDGGGTDNFVVSTGAVDDTLSSLEADYNEIRSQIDALVEDANYRGTNLLGGDDLITTFNETRSNQLTTNGVDFTAAGLDVNLADFSNLDTINTTLTEIRGALAEVRNFGTTLANNLSIIETRQSFTERTINTLESGADDLTVADQNEEGANLLALQTRQQLGVTSLALASQSQQSVLRLF